MAGRRPIVKWMIFLLSKVILMSPKTVNESKLKFSRSGKCVPIKLKKRLNNQHTKDAPRLLGHMTSCEGVFVMVIM